MEFVKEVPLKLPVIAFHGAVLYDVEKKEILRKKIMDKEIVKSIQELLREEKICCFTTALLQETLMIYYEDFFQQVEENIYRELRTSPYRNFIKGSIGNEAECFHIMCTCKQELITKICQRIKELPIGEDIRMVQSSSSDYPGYTNLNIYHKDASKENMLSELKAITGLEKTITFGTVPEKYDILVQDSNQNTVVKRMKKIYEPFIWKKKEEGNMRI